LFYLFYKFMPTQTPLAVKEGCPLPLPFPPQAPKGEGLFSPKPFGRDKGEANLEGREQFGEGGGQFSLPHKPALPLEGKSNLKGEADGNLNLRGDNFLFIYFYHFIFY